MHQREERFLAAAPRRRPLALSLRFDYVNILPDALSHVTCNFYPWNIVVHLARWSVRCLLQKTASRAESMRFLPCKWRVFSSSLSKIKGAF